MKEKSEKLFQSADEEIAKLHDGKVGPFIRNLFLDREVRLRFLPTAAMNILVIFAVTVLFAVRYMRDVGFFDYAFLDHASLRVPLLFLPILFMMAAAWQVVDLIRNLIHAPPLWRERHPSHAFVAVALVFLVIYAIWKGALAEVLGYYFLGCLVIAYVAVRYIARSAISAVYMTGGLGSLLCVFVVSGISRAPSDLFLTGLRDFGLGGFVATITHQNKASSVCVALVGSDAIWVQAEGQIERFPLSDTRVRIPSRNERRSKITQCDPRDFS